MLDSCKKFKYQDYFLNYLQLFQYISLKVLLYRLSQYYTRSGDCIIEILVGLSRTIHTYIHTYNTFAVPVITLTVGILDWTKKEIRQLDITTRKILNYTGQENWEEED